MTTIAPAPERPKQAPTDREAVYLPRATVRDLEQLAAECREDGCHVSPDELLDEMACALMAEWRETRKRVQGRERWRAQK